MDHETAAIAVETASSEEHLSLYRTLDAWP